MQDASGPGSYWYVVCSSIGCFGDKSTWTMLPGAFFGQHGSALNPPVSNVPISVFQDLQHCAK